MDREGMIDKGVIRKLLDEELRKLSNRAWSYGMTGLCWACQAEFVKRQEEKRDFVIT